MQLLLKEAPFGTDTILTNAVHESSCISKMWVPRCSSVLRAKPFIVRFFSGFFKPKRESPGNEFALTMAKPFLDKHFCPCYTSTPGNKGVHSK